MSHRELKHGVTVFVLNGPESVVLRPLLIPRSGMFLVLPRYRPITR